jgi:fructose-1,6-bisphosphatase/inositol monophosphatase family enzyme
MRVPTLTELKSAVESAGQIIVRNFGLPHDVTDKSDGTPVTAIDHEINLLFAQFAEKHGIGFIGEEGNGDVSNDWILYVDPLDGTGAFIRGMATCTVVASILCAGEPCLAVIHNPITRQTWAAERHCLSEYWRNDSTESVIAQTAKPEAGPFRTAICAWPGVEPAYAKMQKRILDSPEFRDQQMGAFAIGGGLIASGLLHATTISGPSSAVETAAMSLIVREAGGFVMDFRLNELLEFKLGEHKGKPDFLLPYGAIIACDAQVADVIALNYV